MSALAPAVPRIEASGTAQGDMARRGGIHLVVRRAKANLLGMIGATIVIGLVLIAIAANWISPFDPNAQVGTRLTQPGGTHVLGLDQLGRDVLSRLIFGARTSLIISAASVGIALLIGGGIGLFAGFYRGWLDTTSMRLMDVLFTLPSIILAIALAGLLGATLQNVILAIAVVTTPGLARVTRAPTLVTREMEFVVGARASGAGDLRIIAHHVLPNVLAPVIVQATVSVANAIIIEASLGFLGLGVPPPEVSWGNMLGTGRQFLELANGLTIFPGLAIMVVVLGFNFAGDGLRDLLDPRLTHS
jgi:ABC-type dipeptide/oligopeptide/nickel transport system permease subunit